MNRTLAALLCVGLLVPYARGSTCDVPDGADPGHSHESHEQVPTAGSEGASGDAGGEECPSVMSCDLTLLATDTRPPSAVAPGPALRDAGIVPEGLHPVAAHGPRPPPPRA